VCAVADALSPVGPTGGRPVRAQLGAHLLTVLLLHLADLLTVAACGPADSAHRDMFASFHARVERSFACSRPRASDGFRAGAIDHV
jgi:hypothetical protein